MILFNNNWKTLKNIELNDIVIFGDSVRNSELLKLLKYNRIISIFDNNSKKWNSENNGIRILQPQEITKDITVVTVLEDYNRLLPQFRNLNYKNVIYGMKEDSYTGNYKSVIDFIDNKRIINRLKIDNKFDFVHILTDQKFFIPIVSILENHRGKSKNFDINKHAFIINGFNIYNKSDKYNVWELYYKLMCKYQNIVIIDTFIDQDHLGMEDILNTTYSLLSNCKEIIFHGEWMIKEVRDFFSKKNIINLLRKKGVWIPWADSIKIIKGNLIDNINKVLKYSYLYMYTKGEIYQYLCEQFNLPDHILGKEDVYYIQLINKPEKHYSKRKNVIIGQSCYTYNKNIECLSALYKFRKDIEVYCIMSYGDPYEIKKVTTKGKELFGAHFHPVNTFMEYSEYVKFLNSMDLAVYAMEDGASFTTLHILFWLGKKVYIKKGSSLHNMIRQKEYMSYDYYDIGNINTERFFDNSYEIYNYNIAQNEFDNHLKHWNHIFNSWKYFSN